MLPTELLALLQVITALLPEVQAAIPVVQKLISGEALTSGDVATLVATRLALEEKAFPQGTVATGGTTAPQGTVLPTTVASA